MPGIVSIAAARSIVNNRDMTLHFERDTARRKYGAQLDGRCILRRDSTPSSGRRGAIYVSEETVSLETPIMGTGVRDVTVELTNDVARGPSA